MQKTLLDRQSSFDRVNVRLIEFLDVSNNSMDAYNSNIILKSAWIAGTPLRGNQQPRLIQMDGQGSETIR